MLNSKFRYKERSFKPWVNIEPSNEDNEYRSFLLNSGCKISDGVYVSADSYVDPMPSISIARNSYVAAGSVLRGLEISIGPNVSINAYTQIVGRVKIGENCRIGSLVSIVGFNHGFSDISKPIYTQEHSFLGIVLGANVWVGNNSIIVDGVTLGSGVIVAAGAVVTKSFDDNVIIAGNPARIIKLRV